MNQERRERKRYVMKEININGEKRYYLIKKKAEQASRILNNQK